MQMTILLLSVTLFVEQTTQIVLGVALSSEVPLSLLVSFIHVALTLITGLSWYLARTRPIPFRQVLLWSAFAQTFTLFEMNLQAAGQAYFRPFLIQILDIALIQEDARIGYGVLLQNIYYYTRVMLLGEGQASVYVMHTFCLLLLLVHHWRRMTQPKNAHMEEEAPTQNTWRSEQHIPDTLAYLNFIKQGVILFNKEIDPIFVNSKAYKLLGAQDKVFVMENLETLLLQGLDQDEEISKEQNEFIKRASQKKLTQKTGAKLLQNLMESAEKRIKRISAISEKLLDQRKMQRVRSRQNKPSFKDLLLSFYEAKSVSMVEKGQTNRFIKANRIRVNLNDKNDTVLEFNFCRYVEQQKLDHYMIFINNITKQEKQASNLQQYQYQQFHFNSFSHELRTPLNCSLALLQALKEQMRNWDQEHLVEHFLKPSIIQNRLLMHQINDILDYASFGMQTFQLNVKPFQIADLFSLLQEYYGQACELKGIKLSFEIMNGLSELVSDFERIIQLLVNLLNNSLKFTEEAAKIRVVAKEKLKSGGYLSEQYIKFIVYDSGRGITPTALQAIQTILDTPLDKDIFLQLKNYTMKHVGLGFTIGNRISKELAQTKKSYFKIRSQPDRFTKVSFRVRNQNTCLDRKMFSFGRFDNDDDKQENESMLSTPLKKQILPSIVPQSSLQNSLRKASLKPKDQPAQILICDDVAFNLISLKLLFQSLNMECDLAYDGQQGIRLVQERIRSKQPQYKLVFMDIEMPVMNGYEATKAVKNLDQKIKVIMCSAYDSPENFQLARECGMTDFVGKPVRLEVLKEVLFKYFN